MKTLTDFKNAIQVGVMLKTTHHQKSAGRDEQGKLILVSEEMEAAPVSIKQTTQFAVKRTRKDGTQADSWMQFGKASECKIEGNKITFYAEDFRIPTSQGKVMVPLLTYEII